MNKKKYSYKVVFFAFIAWAIMVVLVGLGVFDEKQDNHNFVDTTTVSISERAPVYSRTVVREFYPGDTLTSKENGALILWDSTMPLEMIVGVVTDSGTLELFYE
jgi:hypothetical protein